MKLRIESTNPSNKSYLDFTHVTGFEVTKDYASITFTNLFDYIFKIVE